MNIRCKLLYLGLLFFQTAFSQDGIGIGTTTVDNCAILQIESSTKGVLLPRLNTSQINTLQNGNFTLTAGLVLYNTSRNVFYFWNGDDWEELTTKTYVDGVNNTQQTQIDNLITATSGLQSVAPTSAQKAALAGTNGTPSSSNEYVTDSDSRMTNSRTPTGAAGGGLQGTYPSPSLAYPRIEKLGTFSVGNVELDKSGTVMHYVGTTNYEVFFGGTSKGVAIQDNDLRFPLITNKGTNSFSWTIAEGAKTDQNVELTYMIIRTGP